MYWYQEMIPVGGEAENRKRTVVDLEYDIDEQVAQLRIICFLPHIWLPFSLIVYEFHFYLQMNFINLMPLSIMYLQNILVHITAII